jgi:polysaccharide biosynthesis protein PslG
MPLMKRVLFPLALVAALLAAVPAAHAAPRKVPQGFYGAMWDREAKRAPADEQDQQWGLMAASGVETVRTVFSWAHAQPDAFAPPNLAETDALVSLAARHNIELLPIVHETPVWAARNPGVHGSAPAAVDAYTAYLRTLVGRYGPAGTFWVEHPELPKLPIRAWQIWNEPHLGDYWYTGNRGKNAWAREYAQLLKASKPAIEGIDPGATIVLAGLADFAWRHLDRLNRYGIRRYFDVAAINFFTSRPKNVMKGVRYFRRALGRGNERKKPIWLTETTWPAGMGRVPEPNVSWQRAWYTDDAGMASRLRGLYRLAAKNRRKLKLQRVYWYTWASAYRDGDLFDYAGLVRYSDGGFITQPALEAYTLSAQAHQGCVKTAAGVCAP